jgi:hypothetical protein
MDLCSSGVGADLNDEFTNALSAMRTQLDEQIW